MAEGNFTPHFPAAIAFPDCTAPLPLPCQPPIHVQISLVAGAVQLKGYMPPCPVPIPLVLVSHEI